ncbi:MAG: iron ABC transporter permease [Deltaproteobacteria bacterium]|nr:iron ABC transporter permease [Deltaproteobacteria bacterium]
MIALLFLLLFLFVNSLVFGSVPLSFSDVIGLLLFQEPRNLEVSTIILQFRLPRSATAVLAGVALSLSGLLMQTFFKNPLAGPYVLGINSGASFGVALIIFCGSLFPLGFFFSGVTRIAAAFLGAVFVFVLVFMISERLKNKMTLLIVGIMIGYFTSGLVSLLIFFSRASEIQSFLFWTFGSFRGVGFNQLAYFLPSVIVGVLFALWAIKPMNSLLLGEDYAASMGVDIKATKKKIILSGSILTGTTTAFCGPIAFLGIAVPHLCRWFFHTSNHRVLFPAVILMGADIALLAEIIAQLPGSGLTLPLNAVTALLGAPVVIWVIFFKKNI